MDAYQEEINQLRTQLMEVTNSNTSLTGMLAISHMTQTNNMNAMLERCNALERRLVSGNGFFETFYTLISNYFFHISFLFTND